MTLLNYSVSQPINQLFLAQFAQLLFLIIIASFLLHSLYILTLQLSSWLYRPASSDTVSTISRYYLLAEDFGILVGIRTHPAAVLVRWSITLVQ